MKIAVVHCIAEQIVVGREKEQLADREVYETAAVVQSALEQSGHEVDRIAIDPRHLDGLEGYDWIFNLAESTSVFPFAEVEVARWMENLGVPFTGSSSETLRICMDKAKTKDRVINAGIQTPAWQVIYPRERIKLELPFPLFVKPVHEDGSVGIFADSFVRDSVELERKVREIHQVYRQPALVEEYIEGRDITASILGNDGDMIVLQLSETVYPKEYKGPKILTYEAKWLPDSEAYHITSIQRPPELKDGLWETIEDIAMRVYRMVGCQDYAQVDFRLREDTPYFLEINPNPCINPNGSGFVRAGKEKGYSYERLIHKIFDLSTKT